MIKFEWIQRWENMECWVNGEHIGGTEYGGAEKYQIYWLNNRPMKLFTDLRNAKSRVEYEFTEWYNGIITLPTKEG